jgi:RNA polymerase sigma factor (sigma-70 family)
MSELSDTHGMRADPGRLLSAALERDRRRLRNWVRRNVADREEVEDILQDVFFELFQAYRLLQPIEDVTAWLFRVARNRVTDLFRRKRPEAFADQGLTGEEHDEPAFEDLLPSPDAGPEGVLARALLLDELAEAFDALPSEQRAVFYAHEIEGLSFKDIAARTGVPLNTLLSRKHHAVLELRTRLRAAYEEFLEQ